MIVFTQTTPFTYNKLVRGEEQKTQSDAYFTNRNDKKMMNQNPMDIDTMENISNFLSSTLRSTHFQFWLKYSATNNTLRSIICGCVCGSLYGKYSTEFLTNCWQHLPNAITFHLRPQPRSVLLLIPHILKFHI